jgi:Na+/proline symporter
MTSYWQGVLSRLSVPGLILLALGAVLCYGAPKIASLIWKEEAERAITPLKVAGLLVAILGAIILMDLIPNV